MGTPESLMSRLYGWFNERFEIDAAVTFGKKKVVPVHRCFYIIAPALIPLLKAFNSSSRRCSSAG
jgi:hypothetical protein